MAATLRGGTPPVWDEATMRTLHIPANREGELMLELLERGFGYPGLPSQAQAEAAEQAPLADGTMLPVTQYVGAYGDVPAEELARVRVRGGDAASWSFDGLMLAGLPEFGLFTGGLGPRLRRHVRGWAKERLWLSTLSQRRFL